MKIIIARHGQKIMVSDKDFSWLSKHTWGISNSGYAIRYTQKTRTIFMHREVLQKMSGKLSKNVYTDHINRDKLDNRRENLRKATRGQNQSNSIARVNKNGFRGITQHRNGNRWTASILFNRRRIYLGLYKNQKEAAIAYDSKAKEIFGEFAVLNF